MKTLTDEILVKLSKLFRYSMWVKLGKTDPCVTCVKVKALLSTLTLTRGRKYWGVSQIQLRGWYKDKERPVITLVGDDPYLGARDYSFKNFEILEKHEVSFGAIFAIFMVASISLSMQMEEL